jgi:hypothetical protein
MPQIGEEADAVGIAAGDPPIREDQRVHRAGPLCLGGDFVTEGEGGFLVRDGDVQPGETGRRQPQDRGRE